MTRAREWQVSLDFKARLDEDAAFDLMEALGRYGASVAVDPGHTGGGLTLAVDAPDGETALAKARTRADGYAKRLGLRVLRVVSVDETGGRAAPMLHATRGMAVAEQAAADATANAPIAPGENVLGLNLDVVYELGK